MALPVQAEQQAELVEQAHQVVQVLQAVLLAEHQEADLVEHRAVLLAAPQVALAVVVAEQQAAPLVEHRAVLPAVPAGLLLRAVVELRPAKVAACLARVNLADSLYPY